MAKTAAEQAVEIRARLNEITDEFDRLVGALDKLEPGSGVSIIEGYRPYLPEPTASSTAPTTLSGAIADAKKKRGRPPGTGKRDKEVIQILSTAGKGTGFTVNELALMLKIRPNYLYRVLPKLAQQKKIKKVGTRWFIR